MVVGTSSAREFDSGVHPASRLAFGGGAFDAWPGNSTGAQSWLAAIQLSSDLLQSELLLVNQSLWYGKRPYRSKCILR